MCMKTAFPLFFYPARNLHFDVIRESNHLVLTVSQALIGFLNYCANLLDKGRDNGVTWKNMIDVSIFERQCGRHLII